MISEDRLAEWERIARSVPKQSNIIDSDKIILALIAEVREVGRANFMWEERVAEVEVENERLIAEVRLRGNDLEHMRQSLYALETQITKERAENERLRSENEDMAADLKELRDKGDI